MRFGFAFGCGGDSGTSGLVLKEPVAVVESLSMCKALISWSAVATKLRIGESPV